MDLAGLLLTGELDSAAYHAAVEAASVDDIEAVLELTRHADPAVRGAAARTLPLLTHGAPPTSEMVDAAVELTVDQDRLVRDYACLALGEQWRDTDTPAVREALAARLDDIDRDARCEALLGLAYRHDLRVLPRLRTALARPSGAVWRLELVAAGALGEPELHPLVLRHQSGWSSEEAGHTADLSRRLTDPAGPGDDLIDGVAELCRRRARGRPDGESIEAWWLMVDLLEIAPDRAAMLFDEVRARLGDDADARREAGALAEGRARRS
jgi:hypothetical protein